MSFDLDLDESFDWGFTTASADEVCGSDNFCISAPRSSNILIADFTVFSIYYRLPIYRPGRLIC